MNRNHLLKLMALLPFTPIAMKLNDLDNITGGFNSTKKKPVLFLGHGSPMNAIEENEFVPRFRREGVIDFSNLENYPLRS